MLCDMIPRASQLSAAGKEQVQSNTIQIQQRRASAYYVTDCCKLQQVHPCSGCGRLPWAAPSTQAGRKHQQQHIGLSTPMPNSGVAVLDLPSQIALHQPKVCTCSDHCKLTVNSKWTVSSIAALLVSCAQSCTGTLAVSEHSCHWNAE